MAFGARSTMMSSFRPPQKDIELSEPPSDSVSKLAFSPEREVLAVASWDNNVRLYNVNSQGHNSPLAMYSHEGPVLDLAWSKDGRYVFSGGCDNNVKMYDVVANGPAVVIGQHNAPVKCVRFVQIKGQPFVISAGWDKQLKYWGLVAPGAPAENHTVQLSDRAYAMDATDTLCVVGTADRLVHLFDLDTNPLKPERSYESPLKWQTRVISCYPPGAMTGDARGFAIGSIEGRVGVQTLGDRVAPDDKKSFSFKCHRVDMPDPKLPGVSGSQNVYAVNDICFHRQQGTFMTCGADGSFTSWDSEARTKLKSFADKDIGNGGDAGQPPTPIVSMSFNKNNEVLAYALSYDWSKGHNGVPPESAKATRIMLHAVKPDEVTRKRK